MEQGVLALGIACIVAAIVGGGIKLLGVEIPLLNSLARQVLLGLAGALLIGGYYWTNRASLPSLPKIPREVVWSYELGGNETIAPNNLRFWAKKGTSNVWIESYEDGKARNHFEVAGEYHLDGNQCDGVLLRRADGTLIAFVPNDRCGEKILYYQDVDPQTGQSTHWKALGRITKATY